MSRNRSLLLHCLFLVGREYLLSTCEDGSLGGDADNTDQPAILCVSPIIVEPRGVAEDLVEGDAGSIASIQVNQDVSEPLLMS